MQQEFDFSEFFDKSLVTDCLIKFEGSSSAEIRAHKLILANSSNFFFNMFTGQMDEERTGTVNLVYNPDNLLQEAIRWMYNGKKFYEDYDIEKLLKLYAVSAFYTIENLQNDLKTVISQKIPQLKMLNYCDFCYKQGLSETLNYLAVLIGENFEKYDDISKMSDILDVRVYALALQK
ncbi:BTB/POZ domain containing protein [Trichomonas vaginalis G3]|uniref:BTB/POZ domain containing protein n=1 Tax=Trichomonas vaginalis (strain ATCC PRA-98 / G3) TaxID=412133 RepID=A2FR23_TRIV3|nr:protein ubiquitination [Trichomonas vaginalis G3]EAX92653.1 BTB/POZ domain containing protein [Trichomonas vaginalis G3]KAI5535703.1 protein ubiquitination [Trichomonas vaginalis G3]|eukprot:XP_001305583.1 BTB/POZ domain containing protein [Trichomonas vaginalis G3]